MQPNVDDSGQTLERYREFLTLLARCDIGSRFQGKMDLSGIVQQTLLEAYQDMARFQEWSEAQRLAWLRKVLANNLKDEVRRLGALGRDIGRELPLHEDRQDESSPPGDWLAADQTSPSQKAIKHEELLRLADGLAALPEEQRQAVELFHLQGLSLVQIAGRLGRSKSAVVGLLTRGRKRLRELLDFERHD